jgi:fatty acid desaturase
MRAPHYRGTQTNAASARSRLRKDSTARRLRTVLWLAAAMILVAALALAPDGQVHALEAAGAFKGEEISGVAEFVSKLKGNLVWLGGTAMGLIIAVVGIMFMAGHSRAHDLAIRTLVGLAILASISGIVA